MSQHSTAGRFKGNGTVIEVTEVIVTEDHSPGWGDSSWGNPPLTAEEQADHDEYLAWKATQ